MEKFKSQKVTPKWPCWSKVIIGQMPLLVPEVHKTFGGYISSGLGYKLCSREVTKLGWSVSRLGNSSHRGDLFLKISATKAKN